MFFDQSILELIADRVQDSDFMSFTREMSHCACVKQLLSNNDI